MRRVAFRLFAGFILSASALHADAQPRILKLREINFDMWCQEHRHLPPARCDKRLPQDDAAFENYVNAVEHYETQRLNNQAQERAVGRLIESDPVDNPIQLTTSPSNLPPR